MSLARREPDSGNALQRGPDWGPSAARDSPTSLGYAGGFGLRAGNRAGVIQAVFEDDVISNEQRVPRIL